MRSDNPSDMKGTKFNPKPCPNQLRNAGLCPTIRRKTMRLGALFQVLRQQLTLFRTQACWSARYRPGFNAVRAALTMVSTPPIHGVSPNTEELGNLSR